MNENIEKIFSVIGIWNKIRNFKVSKGKRKIDQCECAKNETTCYISEGLIKWILIKS